MAGRCWECHHLIVVYSRPACDYTGTAIRLEKLKACPAVEAGETTKNLKEKGEAHGQGNDREA